MIPPAPVFIFSTILFVEPHENHGVFYSRGGAAGGNRGVLVSLMVPLSTAYTAWPELLPASVYPVRPGFSIIASRPSYWGINGPSPTRSGKCNLRAYGSTPHAANRRLPYFFFIPLSKPSKINIGPKHTKNIPSKTSQPTDEGTPQTRDKIPSKMPANPKSTNILNPLPPAFQLLHQWLDPAAATLSSGRSSEEQGQLYADYLYLSHFK